MNRLAAPVSRLTKKQIVYLNQHHCRHGHRYLDHYNCYLEENPEGIKTGFFDIETTGLTADWGIMICYCIKEAHKNKILQRAITKDEIQSEKILDRKVVKQCIEDLQKFDKIITHYGTRFDIPFVRSRALYHNLPFPLYGEIVHKDTYYMCRNKLQISKNRLENACRHVLGKTRKTHLIPEYHLLSLQGDKKAIKFIIDHCRRDVRDLEDLYWKLEGFTLDSARSI